MSRREFTNKIKLQAWGRANGYCEICGVSLKGKRAEYDHRIPDALGGEATLTNCQVACGPCHRDKSSTQDIPKIAKVKRIIKREAIKPKTKFRGWRNFKGEIVKAT